MPVLHTKPAPRGVGRGEGRGRRKRSGLQRHGPPATSSHTSTARGSIGEAETGSIRASMGCCSIGYKPPGPSMGHRPTPEYRSRSTRGQLHGELHSQLTVNSQSTQQSTHSQLTVNSTVNGATESWSSITDTGRQRPPGPPKNSF